MQTLTPEATRAVHDLAQRYGVSDDAAANLLFAVAAGCGTMAQFSHPEFGGSGQWMQGGMTMVGDMFNHGLQAKVAGLCSDLSALMRSQSVFAAPQGYSTQGQSMGMGSGWWPTELANPSSSGGQNDTRYAYFPQRCRLAIERNGQLSIYDTLDHQIGGVQQQQGGYPSALSFSSQFGTFTVDSLPRISPPNSPEPAPSSHPPSNQPSYEPPPNYAAASGPSLSPRSQDEVLTALERLGDLRQKGILTEDEFRSKKTELLNRL